MAIHLYGYRNGMPLTCTVSSLAKLATRTPYPNPRPVERAAIRELLQNACAGRRPR